MNKYIWILALVALVGTGEAKEKGGAASGGGGGGGAMSSAFEDTDGTIQISCSSGKHYSCRVAAKCGFNTDEFGFDYDVAANEFCSQFNPL